MPVASIQRPKQCLHVSPPASSSAQFAPPPLQRTATAQNRTAPKSIRLTGLETEANLTLSVRKRQNVGQKIAENRFFFCESVTAFYVYGYIYLPELVLPLGGGYDNPASGLVEIGTPRHTPQLEAYEIVIPGRMEGHHSVALACAAQVPQTPTAFAYPPILSPRRSASRPACRYFASACRVSCCRPGGPVASSPDSTASFATGRRRSACGIP